MKTNSQRFEVFNKLRVMKFLTSLAILTLFLAPAMAQESQKAIRDYTAALESDPNFVDAYINRGQVRQSLRDFDGAIADYSKAIELKPDAGVYYARGTVRQAKRDLNDALVDYSKAIILDPNLAQAYTSRAVIETLQGKNVEAVQDFEKAFKIEPGLRRTFKDFIDKRLNVTPP